MFQRSFYRCLETESPRDVDLALYLWQLEERKTMNDRQWKAESRLAWQRLGCKVQGRRETTPQVIPESSSTQHSTTID